MQLCVAALDGSNPNHKNHSQVEAWREWCVESGFEFIVAELEGEGQAETHKEGGDESIMREKNGRERILEALEANMWPKMQMKQRNSAGVGVRNSQLSKGEKKDNEVHKAKGSVEEAVVKRLDTETLIEQFDEEEDEIVRGLLSGKKAEKEREQKKESGEKEEKEKANNNETKGEGEPKDPVTSLLKELSVEDDASFEKALSRLRYNQSLFI